MKNYIKNFVPTFVLTLACFGGVALMPFIVLALLPAQLGTMSASEVAVAAGGLPMLFDLMPIILFICFVVALWVAAMDPFYSRYES